MKRRRSDVPPYLPLAWASEIVIEEADTDRIVVSGKLPMADYPLEPERDVYRAYQSSLKTIFGQKRAGLGSPHIRFANATNDVELLRFVRKFGPVAAGQLTTIEPPDPYDMSFEEARGIDWRTSIRAVQTYADLRREREIYSSALALMNEVQRGEQSAGGQAIEEYVSKIVKGTALWPKECAKQELWFKRNPVSSSGWSFDRSSLNYVRWSAERIFIPDSTQVDEKDNGFIHPSRLSAFRAGHQVLCELVNSFRTEVLTWEDRPIEAPGIFSWLFGVRPILYLILKHAYLGTGGTRVCGNDRCRKFFESERAGQQFCSPECSQRFRQNRYWARSGSKMRKKRRRQKLIKASSVPKVD